MPCCSRSRRSPISSATSGPPIVIATMVVLAITTAFIQEHRSNEAAARLRAMVKTTASVKRRGAHPDAGEDESTVSAKFPMEQLVPGDVVRLSAGDMIPADLRLLSAKDLFLNQAALTGEAMPVGKIGGTPRERRSARSLRPAEHLLHGRQRGERMRHRGHRAYRRAKPISASLPTRSRAARADELRQGRQPVHLADDPLHGGHGAGGAS